MTIPSDTPEQKITRLEGEHYWLQNRVKSLCGGVCGFGLLICLSGFTEFAQGISVVGGAAVLIVGLVLMQSANRE